jgi:hypothetical protein
VSLSQIDLVMVHKTFENVFEIFGITRDIESDSDDGDQVMDLGL